MRNAIARIISNHINANPPLWYDMIVTMNIHIPKGSDYGYAHIPCAFETLTHSIDLNPSLIKVKSKKEVGWFDPKEKWEFVGDPKEKDYKINDAGKKVVYNPSKYIVKLNNAERKQMWELNQVERCSHCGQRTTIAEVKETNYMSCPIVGVRLSDKSNEDLIIPVKFGVARAQFYKGFIMYTVLIGLWIFATIHSFMTDKFVIGLIGLGFGWIVFFFSIRMAKLLKWYIKHRPTAEIKPKQSFWLSLVQQLGGSVR